MLLNYINMGNWLAAPVYIRGFKEIVEAVGGCEGSGCEEAHFYEAEIGEGCCIEEGAESHRNQVVEGGRACVKEAERKRNARRTRTAIGRT